MLTLDLPEVVRGKRVILPRQTLGLPLGVNVALAGLNGAGKTSLLLSLLGALSNAGSVRFSRATRVAYCPQTLPVPPAFTVEVFSESVCGVDFDGLATVFPEMEISRFRGRLISGLSAGERQLLFCLFALAQPADLVLLDEPTAALDMRRRAQVQAAIAERRGLGDDAIVLVASPVPGELLATCGELVALKDGVASYHGPIREFLPKGAANGDELAFQDAVLEVIG